MSPLTQSTPEALKRAFLQAVDNRTLHLVLFVTEQCNFRCTYCYEEFKRHGMLPEVIEGIVNLVDRRGPDLQHLTVSWFGGEPLLATRTILAVSNELNRLAKMHGFDRADSITTNGFLLDIGTATQLIDQKISTFQISLDGPKEYHDTTRVKVRGGGTFDAIYQNLLALRETDLPFLLALRVHVTQTNHTAIPEFVEQLNRDFGGDPRFGLHVVAVESYNTGDSSSFGACVDPLSFHAALEQAHERATRLTILNKPKAASCEVCYAARGNSYAIRSDGMVMKCTVAVDDPKNIVGRLTPDGRLNIDVQKVRPWMAGFLNGNIAALACPYSHI